MDEGSSFTAGAGWTGAGAGTAAGSWDFEGGVGLVRLGLAAGFVAVFLDAGAGVDAGDAGVGACWFLGSVLGFNSCLSDDLGLLGAGAVVCAQTRLPKATKSRRRSDCFFMVKDFGLRGDAVF